MYGTTWAFGWPIATLSGMFSADPDSGALNWIEDCWGIEYGVFAVNGAAYGRPQPQLLDRQRVPEREPDNPPAFDSVHGAGDRHPRARHRQP